jgi:aryl-alcohol dehydrogenase-like predicted oxidoreductase
MHARELPDWARVFANSWGQFFLKYLLGDPRVTAVIPGTGDPRHMADNAAAMRGPFPDPRSTSSNGRVRRRALMRSHGHADAALVRDLRVALASGFLRI